ncbi:MAG: ABC transporter ATP-binding protein [candidate division NC10 bacterium]|nr:ABC transporter ATP-binding protein [candidate division NC10 bacterium]
MAHLVLENLSKRFGATVAVEGLSLEVGRGEFVSLLGPSGCGKTTTLRLVAGLLAPDEGEIWLEGRRITPVPASARGMGMVFQSWALFPNMTAAQNIAFPLRVRRQPPPRVASRVAEVLALVGLEGLEDRYPHELSGGQQQRVGLGRALAAEPRVLLLDEPLSALDAPVRRGLVVELRRLQQQLATTTLYVTHDQEEALSMSDRVALMAQGRIVEVGTPERLYREPASPFGAIFIGATNALVAEVRDPDRALVAVAGLTLHAADLKGARAGQRVRVSVRPEQIRLLGTPPAEGNAALRGRVLVRTFMGAITRLEVECGELRLRVDVPSGAPEGSPGTQQEVWVLLPDRCRVLEVLPVEGGRRGG